MRTTVDASPRNIQEGKPPFVLTIYREGGRRDYIYFWIRSTVDVVDRRLKKCKNQDDIDYIIDSYNRLEGKV